MNENDFTLNFIDEDENQLVVIPRCLTCGRYIKAGTVEENAMGEVRFTDWICSKCGKVEPEWFRL